MRISDWSSDVCSSDLARRRLAQAGAQRGARTHAFRHLDVEAAGIVPFIIVGRAAVIFDEFINDPLLRLALGIEVRRQLGRASCRGRVRQYVSFWGVAVS